MTTPIGRGRGYASLNKNLRKADVTAPAAPSNPKCTSPIGDVAAPYFPVPSNMNSGRTSDAPAARPKFKGFVENEIADENAQSVLFIDERFSNLIDQIDVLSDKDDGILTNQKLQHIESVISKLCTQPAIMRSVMEAIASAAILNSNSAKKVTKLISFSRLQISQQRLHCLFIAALRDKIDGLETSLDGADQYLVNASTLLTDIYTESKCLTNDDLKTLTHLIIQVSVGLLECNTTLSLRTLNAQLMSYGKDLYKIAPEKFDSVSLSVRKLIIAKQPPLASSRLWLVLLADQCLYRFEPLPQYLQDFYARQLDDSSHDTEPRDSRYTSDLPPSHKTNDYMPKLPHTLTTAEYLEKRSSIKSDSSDRWSITSNGGADRRSAQIKDDVFESTKPGFDSDYAYECYGDGDMANSNGHSCNERKPRPILGAGSRMIRKNSKSENDNLGVDALGAVYNKTLIVSNDSYGDIPKFCPSVPPPSFRNVDVDSESFASSEKGTSAAQDSGDFWNYPPPKLPPANLSKRSTTAPIPSSISSRLDLNSWRQNVTDEAAQYQNEIDSNLMKNSRSNIESSNEGYDTRDWDKKKIDKEVENWNRNSSITKQPIIEKRNFEPKRDNIRTRRDSEERELSQWKRRDSDEGKNDDKKNIRRDSRGGGRGGTKKDTMEVSRKASYWTHDDRCDKDYDG